VMPSARSACYNGVQMNGDLVRIDFGADDDRVVLVGTGLPFRFGRITEATYAGGAIMLVIKPDHFTDQNMPPQPPEPWAWRLRRWVRAVLPW
jgi:hypothetical protein